MKQENAWSDGNESLNYTRPPLQQHGDGMEDIGKKVVPKQECAC